jgi:glycine hydroxymethyltransferase
MIKETFEELIEREQQRQNFTCELIASENFPSERILAAAGSILTNKYAEGYPGKRYYGGCQWIDKIEQKAMDNACKLFNCNFANVQPHCGSSANQAVFRAFCKPGDTVLGMDLGAGGHLTHGHKLSFSGQDYKIVSYGVDENGVLDYEDLEKKLYVHNPRMIIVGASSYSQIIDYERIARIIEVYYNTNGEKPIYFVDMAHVAGLVAGGVHPSPFPWADVVTTTTHKTLRGPRGGLILWNNEEYSNAIDKAVFPGVQGGPLEHIIAAKGICFEEALTPEFKDYGRQVVENAKAFANEFIMLNNKVISGGTQNHMFVLDVYSSYGITGKEAEEALDKINITVNKNQIPNDTLSPLVSSGIRIGTPAMTTKGWKVEDFQRLARIINRYLKDLAEHKLDNTFIVNEEAYKEDVAALIRKDR